VSTVVKRSDTMDNSAWQLSASWFLTGERESYNNFVPKSRFTPGRKGSGWGAWELVARVQELRIDEAAFAGGASSFADPSVAPRRAVAYGIGLNWYLDEYVRWMFDYEHTRFDGGGTGGTDRPDERAWPALESKVEVSPLIQQAIVKTPNYETVGKREGSAMADNISALGFIETQGFTAVFEAIDSACKAANVEVLGKEKLGGGYVTVVIKGDVAAVKAAVEAGVAKVNGLGKLIAGHVIARPSAAVLSLLPK